MCVCASDVCVHVHVQVDVDVDVGVSDSVAGVRGQWGMGVGAADVGSVWVWMHGVVWK